MRRDGRTTGNGGGAAPVGLREHRDSALLALVVLAVTGAAVATSGGHGRPTDVIAYLFPVGLAALMFVRRSFPLITLTATAVGILGYYAAGYPPIGLAVPLAGALYSAAEAGRGRWAVGTAAGLLAVSFYFRATEGESLAYLLGYEFASTAGLMAASVALGDGVRARRLLRAEERRRAARAAVDRYREAARQRQQERLRIARDLHDSLAHTTSVISLHTHAAEEALDDDPAAARSALAHVRTATHQAITELRTTVGLLRAPATPPGENANGLGRMVSIIEITEAGGLPVDVHMRGEVRTLPTAVDTAAYRIVQEAIANVVRHSGAASARVDLDYGDDELRLQVTDDGTGPYGDRDDAGGHGIVGMRERADELGGELIAGPLPSGGFRVAARLPWEER